MSRFLVLSLVMAACTGGPGGGDEGPRKGLWQVDPAPNQGWFCARAAVPCSAPTYFTPMPQQVEIRGGGVIDWDGLVEHDGAVEPACIRVAAATEEGVPRGEATFCNLIDGGVVNDARAFVMIGWSAGTPDECTCSAHFDYVGE